ncbi:sensor domain-containing diguanylate cyclase [Cellulomonas sp. NS3]|uniref:sensor domain-containing diguanylate cyclase n=1 Tax=Cellulomonas sp. NS3 TaxID=2973977 RepID=UPI0021617253|nr:sensor domain-containing diguanylate cyclase [Cellulomonas sp. NS3]
MNHAVAGDAVPSAPRATLAWVLVALAALNTVAFVAELTTGWSALPALGHVLNPLVATLAVVLCWRAAQHPTTPVAARTVWRLTAAGMAFIAVSIGVRLVIATGASDVPAPAHTVLQVTGAVLLAASIVRIPLGLRTRTQKAELTLDVATLVVAAGVLMWHLVVTFAGGEITRATVSHVAPVMAPALMAVLLAAKAALAGSGVVPRRALYLRAVSALVGGFGSAVGVLLLSVRPDVDVQLLLNPIASVTIALSAHLQIADAARAGAPAARPRTFSTLPYVAVVAVAALLVRTSVQDAPDRLVVVAAAVTLTALVIVRQLLAFRQNAALLSVIGTHERQFRLLVQNSSDIVTITEPGGAIRYVSPSVLRVLGRDPDSLLGRHVLELAHPDDHGVARAGVASVAGTPGATATYEMRLRHADGSWRWLEVVASNLVHEPHVEGLVSNARDVTETREVQERLSHQATHDALTGLANRALFGDRVRAAVSSAAPGERLSLVLVDLDDFKSVNDTLGHAVGDGLLVEVAARMSAALRASDTVARLGGDEFAILLSGLDRDAVDAVLARIVDALLAPVEVEGHRLVVRASFGVVDGAPGDDPAELLRQADIAMYEAKRRGEGGFQRYRPGSRPLGSPLTVEDPAPQDGVDVVRPTGTRASDPAA